MIYGVWLKMKNACPWIAVNWNYEHVIKQTRMCEYCTKYTEIIWFKFNQKKFYCNDLEHYGIGLKWHTLSFWQQAWFDTLSVLLSLKINIYCITTFNTIPKYLYIFNHSSWDFYSHWFLVGPVCTGIMSYHIQEV